VPASSTGSDAKPRERTTTRAVPSSRRARRICHPTNTFSSVLVNASYVMLGTGGGGVLGGALTHANGVTVGTGATSSRHAAKTNSVAAHRIARSTHGAQFPFRHTSLFVEQLLQERA
jgi:hypothetical protein